MENAHDLDVAVAPATVATPLHGGDGRARALATAEGRGAGPARKRRRRHDKSLADQADRHELYERAVQQPDADIEFFAGLFAERFGHPLRALREDFCGTALLAAKFVSSHCENRAWAVDIDADTLASGQRRHVSRLASDEQTRLKLVQADVRESGVPKVDLIAALNFSYCVFKTRSELRRYLEVARAGLRDQGLLVLDIYGGPDAQRAMRDKQKLKGFTYVWHQKWYDAITSETRCHIHFKMPDGSTIKKAFTYDWRLWTVRELCELLEEAGFARADVYWEGPGEDFAGDGVFVRRTFADNEEAWVAYVVGGP